MKLRRLGLEMASTIPVGGYIGMYPLFKLFKNNRAIVERWYALVFSVVYYFGDAEIKLLKSDLFSELKTCTSFDEELKKKNELRILEIGPGFGGNFQYYPEGTKLTTVEIQPYMEKNVDKVQKDNPNIQLVRSIIGTAENMAQVPDNSVDVLVGTLVLCCINDPAAALAEIRRVLTPGGRFFFMESVEHPADTFKSKVQRMVKPFWKGFTIRCRAGTFDAVDELKAAGFTHIETKNTTLKELPTILSRFQYGYAVKTE